MNPNDPSEQIQELLEIVRSLPTAAPQLPQGFLTVKNAAAYSDLSEESVRRLCSSGKLTALRPVKGRILIDRKELDAFIRSCNQKPRTGRGLNRSK